MSYIAIKISATVNKNLASEKVRYHCLLEKIKAIELFKLKSYEILTKIIRSYFKVCKKKKW